MGHRKTQIEIDRGEGSARTFWKNVEKIPTNYGECWLWTGDTQNNHNTTDELSYDYGIFKLTDDRWRPLGISPAAHRVVLFLTYGREVPPEWFVYPGDCGNRLCVNPDHLWVRNPKGNIRMPAAQFFAADNDNARLAVAASA